MFRVKSVSILHPHLLPMSSHNTQSNEMHCTVPRYFILQYHIEQSYMFRSLMGSSSGNHIKVTLHKAELASHVHNENIRNVKQLKCRRLLYQWIVLYSGLETAYVFKEG